jgi:type II secretory pathway pseudopilin PulG
MLTVIAVIGIITSMALAVFGGASQSADDAKNRRNAQEIASVASSASAAGIDCWRRMMKRPRSTI